MNGWFSDKGCAAAKIASADITPNGTTCVKKSPDDGAAAVFVDQKAGRMYEVVGYAAVKDDVGFYLEVDATLDETAKTITIRDSRPLIGMTATTAPAAPGRLDAPRTGPSSRRSIRVRSRGTHARADARGPVS